MRIPEFGPISMFVAVAVGAVGLAALDRFTQLSPDGRTVIVYAGDIRDKPLLDQFMRENPDIKVEAALNTSTRKLATMIAGKTAPDVMTMGQSFGEFARRGAFLDITDLAERDIDLDEYYPKVLDWYRDDVRLYGFPNVIDMQFIVYNVDLFEQSGVALPTEDWTLEEFLDRAKRLTVKDGRGRVQRFGFRGGLPACNFGGYYLTPDHQHSAVNSPEMISAVQFALDAAEVYQISPPGYRGREELGGMKPVQSFVRGELPIFGAFAWHFKMLVQSAQHFRWRIARNPMAGTQKHWTSSDGYAIYRGTKHPEEAWRLVKFMVSPESIWFQCKPGGSRAYRLPSHRQTAEKLVRLHEGMPENPELMLKLIPNLNPSPRVPDLSRIEGTFMTHAQRAALGLETPEQAMQAAHEKIEYILAKRLKRRRKTED